MKVIFRLNLMFASFGLFLSNTAFAQPVCPSQDFKTFIKLFAADKQVQQSFTANPLTLIYLESVDLNYQIRKEQVDPQVQDKHYFLPVYNLGHWSPEIKVSKKSKHHYYVRTTADNTVLRYEFKKRKDCWYLTTYRNMGI